VTLLANCRVVTPGEILSPGWVHVKGSAIESAGAGHPPPGLGAGEDLEGAWVVPGFIDIHVHGGGGASMTDGEPEEILRAAAFHRRHGTTRTLVSLVTADLATMMAGAAAVARLAESGAEGIVGSHLEGPFLSPARRGAQDSSRMLPADPAALDGLLEAGRGTVRMVTLAPELPGGLDLVERILGAGAVAAVGHTDAGYEEAAAAFRAGARVATHLFNGMRPLHHRDPGAVGAALDHPEVVCELVNDGLHLAPPIVRLVARIVGSRRVALITDAISAAGARDGDYSLGGVPVRVQEGRVTLVEGGNIAGSTLTMDQAFRRAVIDVGLPIEDAARAASTTPAGVLGLAGRTGSVAPGLQADLAVLDERLHPTAVMSSGRWVPGVAGPGLTRP
jgi:N-acetylglucosamine-6-phosphate deacetylase